jgi:hypothetical protein
MDPALKPLHQQTWLQHQEEGLAVASPPQKEPRLTMSSQQTQQLPQQQRAAVRKPRCQRRIALWQGQRLASSLPSPTPLEHPPSP